MHKKLEINQIKIKGSCQLGRKVVTHDSESDLPLVGFTECQERRVREMPEELSSIKIDLDLISYLIPTPILGQLVAY